MQRENQDVPSKGWTEPWLEWKPELHRCFELPLLLKHNPLHEAHWIFISSRILKENVCLVSIIKTHKSRENEDRITSWKVTPPVSPFIASGILEPKETLATINVFLQKRTPNNRVAQRKKWAILAASACSLMLFTKVFFRGMMCSMKEFKKQQNQLACPDPLPSKGPGSGLCWQYVKGGAPSDLDTALQDLPALFMKFY